MLGIVIAVLAVALVVNTKADVRDQHRIKVDVTVFRKFAQAHPELGRFGPPAIIIHKQLDEVCGYRKPATPHGRTTEGYCLQVVSKTTRSDAIAFQYRCVVRPTPTPHSPHPALPALPRGVRFCPYRRVLIT